MRSTLNTHWISLFKHQTKATTTSRKNHWKEIQALTTNKKVLAFSLPIFHLRTNRTLVGRLNTSKRNHWKKMDTKECHEHPFLFPHPTLSFPLAWAPHKALLSSFPHSDFNDGNNLRTPALQWTTVLRLTIFRIVVDPSGVTFVT